MPITKPSKLSALRYIGSLTRQARPPGAPDFLQDILPWLEAPPSEINYIHHAEFGSVAPGDTEVMALATALQRSNTEETLLRVPLGGHRLSCNLYSSKHPLVTLMAYKLGGEILFDWRVNFKTYSRSQEVVSENGYYMPCDEQFDAIKALLGLEHPLPPGRHKYKRAELA